MSHLPRSTIRTIASVLALVLTLGVGLPYAVHANGVDDVCDGPIAGADGHTTVRATQAATRPEHCEICHWLRLLRGFDTVAVAPLVALHTVSSWTPAPQPAPAGQLVHATPARAPPA